MISIISISLAALVILGGLHLLAKSKKDNLGSFFLFSSYGSIALGVIIFVGSIVGGVMMMNCHRMKTQTSCHSMQKSSCYSSCAMMNHEGVEGHGHHMKKNKKHHGDHKMSCSKECKKGNSKNCSNPHCKHKVVQKEIEVEEIIE